MKFSLRYFGALLGALLLVLTGSLTGAAQPAGAQFAWLRSAYGVSSSPTANEVMMSQPATDAAGNSYLGLTYPGRVNLDGTWYAGANSSAHSALVKFDPVGHVLWFKPMGNVLDSTLWWVGAPALDAAGNVHVIINGHVQQRSRPRVLEGIPVATGGWNSQYTACFTPQGVIQSAGLVSHGGLQFGEHHLYGTTRAPNGDILIAGHYLTAVVLDTVTLTQDNGHHGTNYGYTIGFVARLSPTGRLRWVHEMMDTDTSASSGLWGVQLDAAGNAYVMGGYTGRTGLGGVAFPPTASTHPGHRGNQFWAKIDPAGRVVRTRMFDPNTGTTPYQALQGRWAFRVRADGYLFAIGSLAQPTVLAPGLTVAPTGRGDLLVVAYDPSGAVQWTRQVGGTDTTTMFTSHDIELKGNDRLYITGLYRGEPVASDLHLPRFAPPTPTGWVARQRGFVLALNQENGGGLWALPTVVKAPWGVHWLSMGPNGPRVVLPTLGDTLRLGNLQAITPPSFATNSVLVQITERYNTLSGAAYLDANANGQQDATEGGFPGGLVVEVNPGNVPCAAPETTGHYDAYVDLGVNFTASLPAPPPHYTVVAQGPPPVTFSTYGNVAAGRSFALQPIANRQDVQVQLVLNSPARPGFPAVYLVQYRNVGTVPIAAGALSVTLDARLTYQRSVPAATVGSGGLLAWTYANLLPGEARRVRIETTLLNTAVLGTLLTSGAHLEPLTGDLEPADNDATESRTIIGSFDPNDIQVNHVLLSTTQVAAGEWLEYTIRFQNHGSDTAFTVLVRDSLAAHLLRLPTMQLLFTSHTCGWSISPTGQVLVRFPGINLPPQSTNLLEADGFVRFRIRPAATLAVGDQIPNQAYIHFDYNAPFPTNTALTRIQTTTGQADEAADDARALVWPNPTAGVLHLEAPRTAAGILVLTLTDALGRLVHTAQVVVAGPALTRATLDVRGLPAGLYVLRGTGAGPGFARRVVVSAP